jgi:hypothetical protein
MKKLQLPNISPEIVYTKSFFDSIPHHRKVKLSRVLSLSEGINLNSQDLTKAIYYQSCNLWHFYTLQGLILIQDNYLRRLEQSLDQIN